MTAPWLGGHLDSIKNTSGSVASDSGTNATTRSARTLSIGNNGVHRSPLLPTRTSGFAQIVSSNNYNQSGVSRMTLYDAALTPIIRARHKNPNEMHLQYWSGSAWIDGPSFATVDAMNAVQVWWTGLGTASGSLRLRMVRLSDAFVMGDTLVTGLNFSHLSGVAYWEQGALPTVSYAVEFIVADDAGQPFAFCDFADANGTDNADGTGSYTDLDDSNFADLVVLPSSGNKRSFKTNAGRDYQSKAIQAVGVCANLRRGGTGPQSARFYLVIGGVRYYSPDFALTTAWEPYYYSWEQNPATAAAWKTAVAEGAALEWGVEARP